MLLTYSSTASEIRHGGGSTDGGHHDAGRSAYTTARRLLPARAWAATARGRAWLGGSASPRRGRGVVLQEDSPFHRLSLSLSEAATAEHVAAVLFGRDRAVDVAGFAFEGPPDRVRLLFGHRVIDRRRIGEGEAAEARASDENSVRGAGAGERLGHGGDAANQDVVSQHDIGAQAQDFESQGFDADAFLG